MFPLASFTPFQFALIVIAGVAIMEGLAWAGHKYILHGPAWSLHKTHHDSRGGVEANDLVSVLFAGVAIILFVVGDHGLNLATGAAISMSLYGVLYAIVHEGLAHGRIGLPWVPVRGYVKRLVQAHRLHHACPSRDGAVAHGFLYAPPVRKLRDKVRRQVHQDKAVDSARSTMSAARLAPPN